MYTFVLTLTKTDAKLSLMKDGESVAEKSWVESRDLGRQLFEGIQALLNEQGLKPADISDFRLVTEVADNFTSVKIAETVQQVFMFAVQQNKSSHL